MSQTPNYEFSQSPSATENIISSMEENLKHGNYESGVKDYFKFCARARQDIPCASDETVGSMYDTIQMFKLRPVLNRYHNQIESYMNNKTYLQVAKEVLEETKTGKLEDASWVAKYGMGQPFFNQPIEEVMKPFEECQKIRLETIESIVNKLEQYNK